MKNCIEVTGSYTSFIQLFPTFYELFLTFGDFENIDLPQGILFLILLWMWEDQKSGLPIPLNIELCCALPHFSWITCRDGTDFERIVKDSR